MTIDVEYAKNFQKLTSTYYENCACFENIEEEARKFDENAYNRTISNCGEYDNKWTYFKEQVTNHFRHYDIVEIAKTLRKLLKNEFGNDIKFSIRSERGFSSDTLWIKIKPQNEKYLQPLDEYIEDYKEQYLLRHGIEHPYVSDEVFEDYCKVEIARLDKNVRETIRSIVDLFKLDNSDIQTDYFDINYVCFYKLEIDGKSRGGYTGL